MSTFRRQQPSWVDHSRFSRKNLGAGVYGQEYDQRVCEMATGSDALLRALWRSHQRVMLVAEAKGRLVVRP